jgi:cytidylate kinase
VSGGRPGGGPGGEVVVAIDGPAGAGKSTVARRVAAKLGLDRLDTGAMYRAVTLAAMRRGVDPGDGPALAALVREADIEVGETVLVDGTDASAEIRGPEVTARVSEVSAHPEVRAEMVRRQRAWVGTHGGGVVEGRDIGSVVFPDAAIKVFLTASHDERARRRAAEMADASHSSVAEEMARRDRRDSTRATSPLTVADGAALIDTTGKTIEEVADQVVGLL